VSDVKAIDRRRFIALTSAALAGIAGLLRCSHAGSARAGRSWISVQSVIDGYVAAGKLAGAAAALSYGGEPLAYPRAGKIALHSSIPFDQHSICRIYSMSKPVTGAAAMMLIEDGRLALDQPVADVLPEFSFLRVAIDIGKGLASRPATRTMTIRHLLTHTSGLGYWTPMIGVGVLPTAYRERGITPGNYGARLNRPGYGPQAKGLVEMVERVAELPLAAEPGTAWNYSIGLDVMGLVIERISGKALGDFVNDRIFTPLGMGATGFQVAPENAARLTTNYMVTPEGLVATDDAASSVWLQPPPLPAGGGGLVSTASEFARFGEMLLGDGKLGHVRLMKPSTARLMRSNLLPVGVAYEGGGFGAGARVGQTGTFDWGGAAGTLWMIDPQRRGNMVFMSQHMPPETYPIRGDLQAAIEADLRSAAPPERLQNTGTLP
jgi:CubicO group peptidase (beta-lactamase class C family)